MYDKETKSCYVQRCFGYANSGTRSDMYLRGRAERIIENSVAEYGICKGTRGWWVKAPLFSNDSRQTTFKSKNRARQWQLAIMRSEFGMNRVELVKRGRLCILRKFGCGVTVRETISRTILADGCIAEYLQYGVFWRDHDGIKRSKIFSRKQYGDNAEREANWFAAQQRARLTNSELNLPEHWTIHTFQ